MLELAHTTLSHSSTILCMQIRKSRNPVFLLVAKIASREIVVREAMYSAVLTGSHFTLGVFSGHIGFFHRFWHMFCKFRMSNGLLM